MTRPSNQFIEQHYFELFRKVYSLPHGEIKYTDKPDVIIKGAQTIGIEIANLYISDGSDPASEQVQRVRREQVRKRAQLIHQTNGGRNIELSIDFEPSKPIVQIEPIAEAIASLAMSVQNQPSGALNRSFFGHIPELRFVYCNTNEYQDAQWRSVQTFEVPLLSVARLQQIVSEKSTKRHGYQKCDTYWLLLVVDFMDSAQDQQLNWPTDSRIVCSSFEQILVYKPQFNEVLNVPQAISDIWIPTVDC
jgi:hypothetical protein